MNRRGFLTSILAAGAAPFIARAESLMPIVPSREILVPTQRDYDEAVAWMRANWIRGHKVLWPGWIYMDGDHVQMAVNNLTRELK